MNRSQLETLLRQHHREAYLWARQCCGFDGELAKDVIQQVYLKILEGKAKLKMEAHPKTWLFSVIRFTAMDELRKLGKWESLDSEREIWEEIETPPDDYEGLIRQLPKMQQEVLLMVFYHDMTLEQSAEVLQLHIGTIRTHYDRGKKKLKEWIERQKAFEV
ncbi:RNA polymerase sigma-70 factor (ECF subfamily) [Algoriphagus boseongensis]|uniref:RNA polymerase sigma-70 factor (ECF subfamily) n=1 Tax=Algoriphagus boseongensis TaxID=1442587 RepID=A0A4R6T2F3_9BACT|nr:sigma-70 family RNA polymerase sigma factor [Algoriphagus boseongensis]TDQ14604.1 RNA polymerase sigma-70 factor (ECF subfamily) [Algoriphagus boseongensis]